MSSEVVYAEFNDAEVSDFIRNMGSRLKKIKQGERKFTGLLSAIVFQDVMDHFKQQMGSDGKWDPWSKIYKDRQSKKGYSQGTNMLKITGRLRNNFKPTSVRQSSVGPIWFNDAQTKKGFPYAYAHDTGGPILPKRDFMWLSDAAAEKITDQTLAFILEEKI